MYFNYKIISAMNNNGVINLSVFFFFFPKTKTKTFQKVNGCIIKMLVK